MRFALWPVLLAALGLAPLASAADSNPPPNPPLSLFSDSLSATFAALPDDDKDMLVAMAKERQNAQPDADVVDRPLMLQINNDDSVYAPAALPSDNDLFNQGGVNLDITVTYLNHYVYRGIDRNKTVNSNGKLNLQPNARVTFNLGEKAPHPYLGVFVNIFNSDPVSRFQEIRPYFGFTWQLRPFIFELGDNSYIYPERENTNSGEVYAQITLMDETILRTDEPILRPYIYAAYDYDRYNGLYLEVGVQHTFHIEKTGLSFTATGLASYVNHFAFFASPSGQITGLQRYQFGLQASYNLNGLLNISHRYGQWSINGYAYYTNRIGNTVRTDRKFWGGGGIEFSY